MHLLSISTCSPQIIHFFSLQSHILLFLEFLDGFRKIRRYFRNFFYDIDDAIELSLDKLIDICPQSLQSLSIGING